MLKAVLKEETCAIANIYAVKLYQNLSNLLRTCNDFRNEGNIIIGGDFNCPLNIALSKKGGTR